MGLEESLGLKKQILDVCSGGRILLVCMAEDWNQIWTEGM